LREKGAWAYSGLPKFMEYPLLSQERVKLRSSNLAGIFIGFIRTKAPEKFGRKGWWAYPGTSQIFKIPPIISGTCKSTNFKFGRCIQSDHVKKSPLIIWEKRERGRIQGLSKFFEYPQLSQERVKLRTSNFVRTFFVSKNRTCNMCTYLFTLWLCCVHAWPLSSIVDSSLFLWSAGRCYVSLSEKMKLVIF